MCLTNSSNKQRDNRSGICREGPNGGWKDARTEVEMVFMYQPSNWSDEGKIQRQGWRSKSEDSAYFRALFCLFEFGVFFKLFFALTFRGIFSPIFLQNEERGEAVLFSWMSALRQGSFPRLLGPGKCQVAKWGHLGKNRDGMLNCSFYFLNKSAAIRTASCRDFRSLPFLFQDCSFY